MTAQTMTPSEALVESLRIEGVEYVSGVVGSAFQDALDLFPAAGIRFIPVRHEQAAAHMADGFARVTGRAGVCIGQNGPGCTNMLTGVAAAYYNHAPVVAITPSSLSTGVGSGGFQEIDQMAVFKAATRYQVQVAAPSRMAECMRNAFRESLQQLGPAQIDFPRDYLYGDTQQQLPEPHTYRQTTRRAAHPDQLEEAAALLAAAKRPMIISGYGVVAADGVEACVSLAETLSAPVANGFWHNDSFPHDHPLAAGPLGFAGSRAAMELMTEADVVLMLGSRNNSFGFVPQHGIQYYPAQARVIQVDINASELGHNQPVDLAICADARDVAQALYELLNDGRNLAEGRKQWADKLVEHKTRWFEDQRAVACADTPIMSPLRALHDIAGVLTPDTIVALDVGFVAGAALGFLKPTKPRTILAPGNFANCGVGLPTALGAKMGRPDSPVLLIAGDGGWAMSMAEVMTSIEEKLPVTCVILNNGQLGAEKANQAAVFDARYEAVDVGRQFNYAEIAAAMGANAMRVHTPDELTEALSANLHSDTTTVIEAMVDPEVMNKPFRGEALLKPARHLERYAHLGG